eukprot:scaffold124880_cov38-Attheya_sp.AAC.3
MQIQCVPVYDVCRWSMVSVFLLFIGGILFAGDWANPTPEWSRSLRNIFCSMAIDCLAIEKQFIAPFIPAWCMAADPSPVELSHFFLFQFLSRVKFRKSVVHDGRTLTVLIR